MIAKIHIEILTQAGERLSPNGARQNAENFQTMNDFLSSGGQIISQYTAMNAGISEQIFILYKPDEKKGSLVG